MRHTQKATSELTRALAKSLGSNANHHQDEQDYKVNFDTKHEGADVASGVNPSKGDAQLVKRDMQHAERHENKSSRSCAPGAKDCRSAMPKPNSV